MKPRLTIGFMACSVVALYIETLLQIYVSITAQSTSFHYTPVAIASQSLVLISFICSTIASARRAHTTKLFDGHRFSDRIIFICLHVFCLGFVWRLFKYIAFNSSKSNSNAKDLAIIRLTHVALQSVPYFVMYSGTFITAGKINVIQALSLILSVTSSVFAVSFYNLRLNLCNNDDVEGEEDEGGAEKENYLLNSRAYLAILSVFLGTFFVLTSRLVSVSMMASQEPFWIFLPLGCHFLVLCVVFIGFSSRLKSKTQLLPVDIALHVLWGIGMSILNCYDLVNDNVVRVMCKYVGFFTVILLENIIFLSFWLLRFDMDYVAKLISVIVVLSAFILGLVIRFAGFNMLHQEHKLSPDNANSLSQTTVLTISNVSAGVAQRETKADSADDFVSIVQASLNRQVASPQSLATLDPNVPQRLPNKRKNTPPGKVHSRSENLRQRNGEEKENVGDVSDHAPRTQRTQSGGVHLGGVHSGNSNSHSSPGGVAMSHVHEHFQTGSARNVTDSIDLDTSLQPDSMFNVSDPGTIRSDMMYDEGGGGEDHSGDTTLDVRGHRHQAHNHKHYSRELSFHTGSTQDSPSGEIPNTLPLRNRNKAFEQLGIMRNEASKMSKDRYQNKIFNRRKDKRLGDGDMEAGVSDNAEAIPSNEFSDAAISSAKTFPIESKKGDLQGYDNPVMYKSTLGRQMNKIIYSLEDTENGQPPPKRYGPNSDDDIVRYKYNNHRSFQGARNRISYTEPGDLSTSENAISSSRGEGASRNRRSSSEEQTKRPVNLPKRDSQTRPHSTTTPAAGIIPRSHRSHLQLCESESSTFSSMTQENNTFTKTSTSSSSSSSSASAKQFYWAESGATGRRKALLLPDEESQIPPSENVLRWLATTEDSEEEAVV